MLPLSRFVEVEGIRDRGYTSPPFANGTGSFLHRALLLRINDPPCDPVDRHSTRRDVGAAIRSSNLCPHFFG